MRQDGEFWKLKKLYEVSKGKDNLNLTCLTVNQDRETCGAPDGICIGAKFAVDMRSGCKWGPGRVPGAFPRSQAVLSRYAVADGP